MLRTPGETRASAYLEVAQFVYSTVVRLNAKNFTGWLELCADNFSYSIQAWSPEIRRDMTWLQHDRSGIDSLVRQLPRHNTDESIFTRHATVYTIDFDRDDAATVVSALTVYRTDLDGGESRLFAVGHYHDRVVRDGERWLLGRREVRLDTRSLGIGTHYPI